VTGCRGREPYARPRGAMAASGGARPNLPPEDWYGGNRREHAVAPGDRTMFAAPRAEGVGVPPRGPRTRAAWPARVEARDPLVPSCRRRS
jgi:hypothetical protein